MPWTDRYIQNIHCVNGKESPKEEPTSWKRKAKGLTKMREKQKDQAKGEELSEAERVCLDEGTENATLHRTGDHSRKANGQFLSWAELISPVKGLKRYTFTEVWPPKYDFFLLDTFLMNVHSDATRVRV